MLALALLVAAGVGTGMPAIPAGALTSPGELLVYYGWPSLINGATDVAGAAAEFAAYDFVVLGADVELPTHDDHDTTATIITQPALAETLIFGYINLGATDPALTLTEVYQRVDWWQAMGVHGILFDAFGYDYAVTRERQNAAVSYVHGLGMPVVANGWFPDDVFGSAVDPVYNPDGLATQLGAADYYMSESYFVQLGEYQDYQYWKDKADLLAGYQAQIGFGILSVTTNGPDDTYSQELHWAAWGAAAEYGHTATGWGEYLFSADDNLAPFRPRPPAMLRVTTSPAVPSQILVDGVPRDSWGLNWVKLPPGDYEVSFADLSGFTTPPPQTVSLATGFTTEWAGLFVQQGQLRVITSPPVPSTILVNGVPRNDWGMWSDLPVGSYEVCFGEVAGFTTPQCQTADVNAGLTTTVTGDFVARVGGAGGFPLPAAASLGSVAASAGEAINSYIVVLKPGTAGVPGVAAGLARAHGGQVGFVYEQALQGFSITASPQAAAALAHNPLVAYVEADRVVSIGAQAVPTGIQRVFADDNPSLDIDGIDDFRVDVDVAVIDTGVDFQHPDLNVAGGIDCSTGSPLAPTCVAGGDDDAWHGTHVAGTIAALDNGIGVVGVAPGARIWAVKVFDSAGTGYVSWAVAGIDWVAAHAGTIEVANMSLGSEGWSQAEYDAIQGAVNLGVAFAVAAGNDHADAANYSPAAFDNVLTVSALADLDGEPGGLGSSAPCEIGQEIDDWSWSDSNHGSVVDVAAPGYCILSTVPIEVGFNYGSASGTSMASPHAAGALALWASISNPDNATDVNDLYDRVRSTGNFDWTDDSGDGVKEPLLDVSSFATGPGLLRVTTSPPVPSQILVDGVPRDSWGLNWMKLPAGSYEISFVDVPGFTTPVPHTVTISSGVTTEWAGVFEPRGYLQVNTNPPVPSTILVDGVPRNDWGMWTDLPVGSYDVCFGEVAGLTTPDCQTAVVIAGQTTIITGSFG